MLSCLSKLLEGHSLTTIVIRRVSGPVGLSGNMPCGFQLLESPLPFLALLVPQDCVQYLGRVSMQLGPFSRVFGSSFWFIIISRDIARLCSSWSIIWDRSSFSSRSDASITLPHSSWLSGWEVVLPLLAILFSDPVSVW